MWYVLPFLHLSGMPFFIFTKASFVTVTLYTLLLSCLSSLVGYGVLCKAASYNHKIHKHNRHSYMFTFSTHFDYNCSHFVVSSSSSSLCCNFICHICLRIAQFGILFRLTTIKKGYRKVVSMGPLAFFSDPCHKIKILH